MASSAVLHDKKQSALLLGLVALGIILRVVLPSSLVVSLAPPAASLHSLVTLLAAIVFFGAASSVSLKKHAAGFVRGMLPWFVSVVLIAIPFYFATGKSAPAALVAAAIITAVAHAHDAAPAVSIFAVLVALLLPLGMPALLLKLIASIGVAVFVCLLTFRFMRRVHSRLWSPLAVVVALLLTVVLAHQLGGSGLLAVTAFGVLFGTVALKEKPVVVSFMAHFTNAASLVVFLLAGFLTPLPSTLSFAALCLALFVGVLLLRYVAFLFVPHAGHALASAVAPPRAVALALLLLAPVPFVLVLVLLFNALFLLYRPKPI